MGGLGVSRLIPPTIWLLSDLQQGRSLRHRKHVE